MYILLSGWCLCVLLCLRMCFYLCDVLSVGLVILFFIIIFCCFFFFKQKTAYEMRISDWSSDVCSSDLGSGRFWEGGRSAPRKGTVNGTRRELRSDWGPDAGSASGGFRLHTLARSIPIRP